MEGKCLNQGCAGYENNDNPNDCPQSTRSLPKTRIVSADPFVCIIDDFLTEEECDAIVAHAQKKGLVASKAAESSKGGTHTEISTKNRASETVYFDIGETQVVDRLEKQVEMLTKIPIDHGEGLQVVHYHTGGYFNAHYDFLFGDAPQATRMITTLIYLNTVEEGGETVFPYLGFGVIPKKGRALLWYNMESLGLPPSDQKGYVEIPDVLTASQFVLHGGKPVLKGEKWIVTKWLHCNPIHWTAETAKERMSY